MVPATQGFCTKNEKIDSMKNEKIARFLMNAMFASGGYPWTIIPVTRRDEYMSALEHASVDRDFLPFVSFIASVTEKTI
jgi:hypothetical protein